MAEDDPGLEAARAAKREALRLFETLAPVCGAGIAKEGGRYDLAIALAIVAASDQIDADRLRGVDCFGELALSGECRRLRGLLPALIASGRSGRPVIVPRASWSQ